MRFLIGVELPSACSVDNRVAGNQNRKLEVVGTREAIKSIETEMTLSWTLLLEEMVDGVRKLQVFRTREETGLVTSFLVIG